MAVKVFGGALRGVDAVPIEVEVDLLSRLPSVCVVGLAQNAVKESADRVRSAIVSSGLEFPRKRVVVNLAPADVKKDGTAFDLPVALGILAADGQIPAEALRDLLVVGELSMGGEQRVVRGALSLAVLARSLGFRLLLPLTSAGRAALVGEACIYGVHTLGQAVSWLRGEIELSPETGAHSPRRGHSPDLSDVRGQLIARRAMEVAAAGAHHLLMMGPPGCGKSMLARRLPSILPLLTPDEALETTRIHGAAGLLGEVDTLLVERPFRAPHHSITAAGMVGDRTLRPGEVSLAHNGVLFLDEATEFARHVIDLLRAPLEEGELNITRAAGSVTYPARTTLVLASNPCPCGQRGSGLPCSCPDGEVLRYRRRLSGPILDRIDLHVELQPVSAAELLSDRAGESSAMVRQRVVDARDRQRARGQRAPNGQLRSGDVGRFLHLQPEARALLLDGASRHRLTGRATTRILKVARTLADLEGARVPAPSHVAEALAFRPLAGLS